MGLRSLLLLAIVVAPSQGDGPVASSTAAPGRERCSPAVEAAAHRAGEHGSQAVAPSGLALEAPVGRRLHQEPAHRSHPDRPPRRRVRAPRRPVPGWSPSLPPGSSVLVRRIHPALGPPVSD